MADLGTEAHPITSVGARPASAPAPSSTEGEAATLRQLASDAAAAVAASAWATQDLRLADGRVVARIQCAPPLARFIAAVRPEVVLGLVADRDRLEQYVLDEAARRRALPLPVQRADFIGALNRTHRNDARDAATEELLAMYDQMRSRIWDLETEREAARKAAAGQEGGVNA